eukprot:4988925-Pleurochrysis_carterae.AAC.1
MRLALLSPVQLLHHSLKKVRHAHIISQRLVVMNANARRHESAERRARVSERQSARRCVRRGAVGAVGAEM